MMKKHYKKQLCKYGDHCRFKDCSYLCKFAHYEEEKKKVKFKLPNKSDFNHFDSDDDIDRHGCVFINLPTRYLKSTNKIKKKTPDNITILSDCIVGVNQFLRQIPRKDVTRKIILSYLVTNEVKRYINTIDKCNWCNHLFSYKYEDDYYMTYRHGLVERKNPFVNSDYRKTCNIGPLCLNCSLYKIPIRCDVCDQYTNANNMEFNYDLNKDNDLMTIFSECGHDHYNPPMNYDQMFTKPCNICTVCLFEYYNKVMSAGFYYCTLCVYEYKDIISYRFGSKIADRYI